MSDKPVARVGDKTDCPAHEYLIIPHLGGPLSNAMPVCMEANGKRVIRLADYGTCFVGPLDVVFEGSSTVVLCGLPVARKDDHMAHGGHIAEGSPNVVIGGPTFALPRNMTVNGPADFRNKVIRDLYKLSTTPTGKTVLGEFDKAGGSSVEIVPESDPHNSFCTPLGGGNSRVNYNPDVAIYGYSQGTPSTQIPLEPTTVFGHELVHAYNNSTGTALSGNEPGTGPASQPNIEREEEITIGTGNYNTRTPSENSLRDDLGLPRRDNHYGTGNDAAGNNMTTPPSDIRPGAC
ncbi:MAG: M91 family zinc metallopeptidase [Minicystis sp.]